MKNALILFLLLFGSSAACAQKTAGRKESVDFSHVYSYVEKMPQLPEGGGMPGIVNVFLLRFHLPAFTDDGITRYSGIQVTFVVGTDGKVRDAKMLKSANNTAIDNALLAAARKLPNLSPGYQNGKAVPVRLTIPISCIKPQ